MVNFPGRFLIPGIGIIYDTSKYWKVMTFQIFSFNYLYSKDNIYIILSRYIKKSSLHTVLRENTRTRKYALLKSDKKCHIWLSKTYTNFKGTPCVMFQDGLQRSWYFLEPNELICLFLKERNSLGAIKRFKNKFYLSRCRSLGPSKFLRFQVT